MCHLVAMWAGFMCALAGLSLVFVPGSHLLLSVQPHLCLHPIFVIQKDAYLLVATKLLVYEQVHIEMIIFD